MPLILVFHILFSINIPFLFQMQLTTVFHLLFFNMHSKSLSTIFHSRPKSGTHIFHPNYLFFTAIYIVRLYCNLTHIFHPNYLFFMAIYIVRLYCSLFSFFMTFSTLSRSCIYTLTLYSYML